MACDGATAKARLAVVSSVPGWPGFVARGLLEMSVFLDIMVGRIIYY